MENEFTSSVPKVEPSGDGAVESAGTEISTAPKTDGHLTVNTEFSSSQLTKMANWAIEAGTLTIDEANKMLAADGAPQIKPPVDPNSPEAYIDKLMPPADAQQFLMPEIKFTDDPTGREALAVDKLARGWLSEARFTRETGSFIAEEANRTASRFDKMSEIERRSYRNEQASMLEKIWKGDTARKLNLAKSLVNHLESKSPGLRQLLENTGAGNNAMIVAQFAMQAEVLVQRKRK